MKSKSLPVLLWCCFLMFVYDVVFAQGLTLSINDVTTTDGNGGSNIATFTITRSGTGSSSSVQFSTSNGTATGGSGTCSAGEDFLNLSSGVSFNSGETSKQITITTCGDTLDEADETFSVNLTSPGGATIADGQGVATIVDDDNQPSLRINDVTLNEGNAGTQNASLNVTLNNASGLQVTVVFATANDTATGGAACGAAVDFVNINNSLTFAPGVTSQPINVTVCGDTVIENNERLRVNLSTPTNATIADSSGFANITTNDTPNLSITDQSLGEPSIQGSITFTLTMTAANPNGASVTFKTVGVTATQGKLCGGGTDYLIRTATLNFGPTEVTKTISVPVCGDSADEPNETFTVQLSNGQGLNIGDPTAVGTIIDND